MIKPPEGTTTIGRFHRKEGDERRHSHRCFYFNKETRFCRIKVLKCSGAAQCNEYREDAPTEYREAVKEQNLMDIEGIAFVDIKLLSTMGQNCKNDKVVKKETSEVIKFYDSHKKLDKPIIVKPISESILWVKANFAQYYAAVALGMKRVPVATEQVDRKEYFGHIEFRLRRCGAEVEHQDLGKGIVIKVINDVATVEFSNGEQKDFFIPKHTELKSFK